MRRGEGEEFEGVIAGTDGQADKDKIRGTVGMEEGPARKGWSLNPAHTAD